MQAGHYHRRLGLQTPVGPGVPQLHLGTHTPLPHWGIAACWGMARLEGEACVWGPLAAPWLSSLQESQFCPSLYSIHKLISKEFFPERQDQGGGLEPSPPASVGGLLCFPIKYSQWVFLSVAPTWARAHAKCQHLKHQQGRGRAAWWQAKVTGFSASLGKQCPGAARRKVLAQPPRPLGDHLIFLPHRPALPSARTTSSTGFKAKKLQCVRTWDGDSSFLFSVIEV